MKLFHETEHGKIYLGDSLDVMASMEPGSVDLVMTSPPFALLQKKPYGNADSHEYLEWFKPFAAQLHRVLKDSGSLVIDIGGAWIRGQPTRSLYHFQLLIMLCEEYGFHLAQEFYWWSPTRLPTAEWVMVRRVRVRDAVNTVWWLGKTAWPKASNRRVLQPYSPSMQRLIATGYTPRKRRPSGHAISAAIANDNGAAIAPNLIALPNSESNSYYHRYCRERGIKAHPARYPAELPEYFIRMCTDEGDMVLDPFAGSCVTGEVAERLQRKWVCAELIEEYLEGALGRFTPANFESIAARRRRAARAAVDDEANYYRLPRPGILWSDSHGDTPLAEDGGRTRVVKRAEPTTEDL